MSKPLINTSGTRYSYRKLSEYVWALDGWQDFLKNCGLADLDQFINLSGELIDHNSRSLVYCLFLGEEKRRFYLKVHKNYVQKRSKTFGKTVPMVQVELRNLMHYARIGLDALEPVAWGWRQSGRGGDSFVLLEDLYGFRPLHELLASSEYSGSSAKRRDMFAKVAGVISHMHSHGIAHRDLFAKHVFVKEQDGNFIVQPIDLERTVKKGRWPGAGLFFFFKKVRDIAVLFLTVPWPEVSRQDRLRFFLRYLGHSRLTWMDKILANYILKKAKCLAKASGSDRYSAVGECLLR